MLYYGQIKISGNGTTVVYYNFYPCYRYEDGVFHYLTDEDLEDLLPESKFFNINLSADNYTFLPSTFEDYQDVLIDFTFEDLEPNLNKAGIRYDTGYKLNVTDFGSDRIRKMEDLGYFYVVKKESVLDGSTDAEILVDDEFILPNQRFYVQSPSNPRFLMGPFQGFTANPNDERIKSVKTMVNVRNYIRKGRLLEENLDDVMETFSMDDYTIGFLNTNVLEDLKEYEDLITDEQLLTQFRDALAKKGFKTHALDLSNVNKYLLNYESTVSRQNAVPKQVLDGRVARIRAILKDDEQISAHLDEVASLCANLLFDSEGPRKEMLLSSLAGNPDFLNRLPQWEQYQHMLANLNIKIQELSTQKALLEAEVADLQAYEASGKLEEARQMESNMVARASQARSDLETLLAQSAAVRSLDDLEERVSFLQEDIDLKSAKRTMLAEQIQDIEDQLDAAMENRMRRVMETSFDQSIQLSMKKQQARLELQNMYAGFIQAAKAMDVTASSYLDGENLREYLINYIRFERQELSYNETVNLLICLAQGMLVFIDGESGSGKSSLVRTLANALGLGSPDSFSLKEDGVHCSRYCEVAVTPSFREAKDYIGSYDASSLSVIKSGTDVFDLLGVMHAEHTTPGIEEDLMGLILFDDANTAPMESYFAPFMNAGIDKEPVGQIALGSDIRFELSPALRFAGTLSHDYTSRPVPPRIMDRAWTIQMGVHDFIADENLKLDLIPTQEVISFSAFTEAFGIPETGLLPDQQALDALERLMPYLSQCSLAPSNRSMKAIFAYMIQAVRLFKEESPMLPVWQQALDFALAQRILPQISGTGKNMQNRLEKLREQLRYEGLERSEAMVSRILKRGSENMLSFQYFG